MPPSVLTGSKVLALRITSADSLLTDPDLAVFLWEDPPPPARVANGYDWIEALKPLSARPGKWARVGGPNKSAGLAGTIKKKLKEAGQGHMYEVVSRRANPPEGEFFTWARFLAPADRGAKS